MIGRRFVLVNLDMMWTELLIRRMVSRVVIISLVNSVVSGKYNAIINQPDVKVIKLKELLNDFHKDYNRMVKIVIPESEKLKYNKWGDIIISEPKRYYYPKNLFVDIFNDTYQYDDYLGIILLNIFTEDYQYKPRDLQIVKLRYKYMHTYEEISHIIELSPARIRQILIEIICKTRFISQRDKIFSNQSYNKKLDFSIIYDLDEWYQHP